MEIKTIKQIKVFDIKASGQVIFGHGYSDEIEGITWVEGAIWESDEQCEKLLAEAIEDWEKKSKENPWGTTSHKPKLRIYWKNY